MKRLVVLISVCCCVLLMQASIHNVKDYGARADGVTIDSPAINRAISAAAGEGGGTVYIPAGEYAIPYGLPAMFIFIWNKVRAS